MAGRFVVPGASSELTAPKRGATDSQGGAMSDELRGHYGANDDDVEGHGHFGANDEQRGHYGANDEGDEVEGHGNFGADHEQHGHIGQEDEERGYVGGSGEVGGDGQGSATDEESGRGGA